MSKLDKVRIGIVGAGKVAQTHLKNYAALDDVEVAACADIDEAAARRSASTFGIPSVYANFRDLLARSDIDAVDVCLHNNYHMPITVAALEAGKHVYCEKPMAGSYCDALTMLQTAKKRGKKLHIEFFTLFSDETRAARELIDGGELGELYHARSTGFRRRGRPYVDGYGTPDFVSKRLAAGGALYDMGAYHIAQLLWLLGNPKIERITGKTYQKIDMDPKRRRASGYDVEELAVGFVRLAGGVSLDIVEAWAAHLDGIEGPAILGSRGGIRLRPFGFFKSYGNIDVDGAVALDRARFRWENLADDGAAYASSQAHWVAALQGRVDLMPTAEVGLATMLVSEGIYLSERLGREVTGEEVETASVSTAVPM
ncbi:MAG TPA: Gfo/Idh/MocA family oxidoreductase [Polyangiaceae bacterium]